MVSKSRRRLHKSVLASLSSVVVGKPLSGLAASPESALAASMTKAAIKLLMSLTGPQQKQLVLPRDSEARREWHYTPRRRPGLTLAELSNTQQTDLWALLTILLSQQGLQKAKGAIRLEGILGELTGRTGFRDPENYALVMFGRPGGGPDSSAAWSWRFEGHHLSLSVAVAPGKGIAVTPAFFGANPQTVPSGHDAAGLRIMPAEADLAFELINRLPATQQSAAIINTDSPGNIIAGPGREQSLQTREGVPLSALDSLAKAQAIALIEAYIANMAAPIAARERRRLEQAGLQQLQLAWAGSLQPGRPHYYRLHGPTLLIEYDNTQNGANHVHSVWHDPADSFGADLLKAHYDAAPHAHGHHHA